MIDAAKVKEIIGCYTPMETLPEGMTVEQALKMFEKMCLIRNFEFRVRDMWRQGKINGPCHAYLYAEAIAVAACNIIEPSDYITSTHRGHGHVLARGGDPKLMIAELLGKAEGYNKGKGGSMHIADVKNGILGATGIVGSGIGPATGAALSSKLRKENKVSVCFFGDGASNSGAWAECVNMAAAWNLPIVFLCENNLWGIGTDFRRVSKGSDIYQRAEGYGVPSEKVDGFNVFEVYKAVKKAVDHARSGKGPAMVEASFLRMLGHHVGDEQQYRDKTEIDQLWEIEPISRTQKFLNESCNVEESLLEEIMEKTKQTVEEAVYYAENECTEPSIEDLYTDIYANGEIIK